jgi:SAM-dependent methyltransferase
MPTMVPVLQITSHEIRRAGRGNVLAVCWRQWRAERGLERRGLHFRSTASKTVAAAYSAMTEAEFDAVNGRQDWANWRTIPRALNGHVPNRSLRVLDLGCGTGGSTRVLAWYAPAGSIITGYELADHLLLFARRRNYRNRQGGAVEVDFVSQAVNETLRLPDGRAIPHRTIDVVNASGVVGHHLNPETIAPLITELRRVLVPGGVAMLDVGPALSGNKLRGLMIEAGFMYLGHYRSGWWDPTGEMVFQQV